ncbi:N-acyl homoserine lactonase family protein [Microbacterium gorillae]|uniref:N-acyl homoserine lactonase family protein n=1 Tax=Microbacterium gorillae TaxID=1231063 RepID=UPI001143B96B|nr:N-acyl homoserine lactonase family protein [Microbacterium gorillae]
MTQFAAPTGTVEDIWTLDVGRLTFDAGLVMLGGSGQVLSPITATLIRHERGLVLFDTGLDPAAAGRAVEEFGELASMFEMLYTPEQRVDAQIQLMGFDPAEVTHVLISHSHFDHSGGMRLFPNAKFYIGAPDLQYVFWPDPFPTAFCRWEDFQAVKSHEWHPVRGDLDLFGDGSIVFLELPGHTPGNHGLMVRLADETILITGDTIHLAAALENRFPMGGDHNTSDTVRSIDRLRQLRDSHDAAVWVTHDPISIDAHGGFGRYRGRR